MTANPPPREGNWILGLVYLYVILVVGIMGEPIIQSKLPNLVPLQAKALAFLIGILTACGSCWFIEIYGKEKK